MGAVAIFVVGCAMVSALLPGGERPLAFSHELHVGEQGLDCESCHEDAWYDDKAGWPYQDTCLVCHDSIDEDKDPSRSIELAFTPDDDGRLTFKAHSSLSGEVIFSHLAHVEAEVGCAECHQGIEESGRVDTSLAVDMGACMDCHARRAQPAECATCHSQIDQDWQPPSHLLRWEQAHGHASRACRGRAAMECSLCHQERSCAECHLAFPPSSHDHAFRSRTHGFHAAMDRRSCATCHRSDSCDTCHAETSPRSHTSITFGGTRSNHCLGCHLPLQANGCQVCHKGTPSHLGAAPKPDWHNPAMNCRQCHGISAPLPHVDKGDNCNACHF